MEKLEGHPTPRLQEKEAMLTTNKAANKTDFLD
jgi:hypothetical protein